MAASFPIYYITGTIHSAETGAPHGADGTRLPSGRRRQPLRPKSIRDNMVTLITPVVEVDGRNRMVDVYNWHLAHPNEN